MKNLSSRSGSAILVVLGMTAFLLVSAIAFSAYMRYARLPSSYLRRSSASRLLVKAGLARAIDAVDVAVNNNPHPNVGDLTCTRAPYDTGVTMRNIWKGRVLIGTNETITASSAIDSSTVSPLCLEALAYIPTPLVNEARFYSRRSPTAHWHTLDYDSGRYSFCALDVSDYFDVNRMLADVPRASAPNRRITLSYLFETGDEHTSMSSGASSWDTFMEKFRSVDDETGGIKFSGSTYPLVSFADFNLALYQQGGIGSAKSAFCQFIEGANGTAFYGKGSEAETYKRMTFVTDGLFPNTDEETSSSSSSKSGGGSLARYDLNDGENQPYTMDFLESTTPALSSCVFGRQLQADSEMGWVNHLTGLGCAALYDYLDPDHVPISLAVPTTERAPMICGIQTEFPGAKFSVTKDYQYKDGEKPAPDGDQQGKGEPTGEGQTRECQQVVYYRVNNQDFLKGFMGGHVSALACFPFSHADTTDGSFTADGRFSFFFTTGDVSLRTYNADDPYHFKIKEIDSSGVDNYGLMNVKLQGDQLNFKGKSITKEEDALQKVQMALSDGQSAIGTVVQQNGKEVLRVTYKWQQTATQTQVGGVLANFEWQPKWDTAKDTLENIAEAHCGFPAGVWQTKAYSKLDEDLSNDQKLAAFLKSGGKKTLALHAAVWLRVRDDQKKTVDLVPACFGDDKVQNGSNDNYPLMEVTAQDVLGHSYPLMMLNTGVSFEYSLAGLDALATTPQEITLTPKTMMVSDPRYNYAPEHWFETTADLTPSSWLENNHRKDVESAEGGAHDIFMATSDAGYLQSPHEVAFLPRFTNLSQKNGDWGFYSAPDGDRLDEIPSEYSKTANRSMMWRTFDPINADADAFLNDLPWTAAGNGYKVNPYSDSTNVLESVFANTPIDWKRASTNEVEKGDNYYDMTAKEFNQKYAYNEYSSGAKFAWRDVEQIAGRFMSQVRTRPDDSTYWQDALADLGDWTSASEDKFCGVTIDSNTDDLWDVDRKFLYGFWSDCFAAKQQLYLIFVRAEPVMMGSGMAGQIPPQLGARAVALVWRDPTKSQDNNTPHRTRILFYRQFE